jgi:outer membrane protein assembly factor BamB
MRVLALGVLLCACQRTPVKPRSHAAPPVHAAVAPAPARPPFVISNRSVAEDGRVVRTLPGVSDGAIAVPVGPHRFEVEGFSVDTAANTVTRLHPPAAFEPDPAAGSDDDDRYVLVRDEPDGKVRWSAKLHGFRSVRPPDLAVGGGRTIATIDLTIHAFDDATGRPLWSANVPGDNLHIAGDAVYSTSCNEPTHDHWLVANALADGAKRFQVPLAAKCDPAIVIQGDRIFAVESTPPEETRVFDLAGHLVTTLHEQVESAQPVSHGLVVVGDQHLMSLDPSGKIRWSRAAPPNGFVGGDDIVELPGGDLLLANYGAISDSGVDVQRLHADGTPVWHARAAPLYVSHSQYEHLAYIEPRGDALFVVSQGSYGAFLEKLSLATGARELRCVLGQRCMHP